MFFTLILTEMIGFWRNGEVVTVGQCCSLQRDKLWLSSC